MNELAGMSAAPAPEAPAAAPADPGLPHPLSEVASGALPAISLAPVRRSEPMDPAQEFVVQNFEQLGTVLDYHEFSDGTSVLFNPEKIGEKDLEKAQKAGKLYEVAPLTRSLGDSGATAAVSAPAPAQGELAPTASAPLSGAVAAPGPSGSSPGTSGAPMDRRLQGVRLKNAAAVKPGTLNPTTATLSKRPV